MKAVGCWRSSALSQYFPMNLKQKHIISFLLWWEATGRHLIQSDISGDRHPKHYSSRLLIDSKVCFDVITHGKQWQNLSSWISHHGHLHAFVHFFNWKHKCDSATNTRTAPALMQTDLLMLKVWFWGCVWQIFIREEKWSAGSENVVLFSLSDSSSAGHWDLIPSVSVTLGYFSFGLNEQGK